MRLSPLFQLLKKLIIAAEWDVYKGEKDDEQEMTLVNHRM